MCKGLLKVKRLIVRFNDLATVLYPNKERPDHNIKLYNVSAQNVQLTQLSLEPQHLLQKPLIILI